MDRRRNPLDVHDDALPGSDNVIRAIGLPDLSVVETPVNWTSAAIVKHAWLDDRRLWAGGAGSGFESPEAQYW